MNPNQDAQHHIATSTTTASQGHRMTILRDPVVRAMISNNRLASCHDVSAMVQDCQASVLVDGICRTATQYLDICLESDELRRRQ